MENGFVTKVERARRRRKERKGGESERRDGPEDGKLARSPRSVAPADDGDATDVVVRAGR